MPVTASIDRITDPQSGSCSVVTLAGRMTLGSSLSLLESQVQAELAAGVNKMVFDLTAVDFLDSAGLGMLIYTYGALKKTGGSIRLCGVDPRILNLLKLTNSDSFLAIDATREDSLAAINA